MVKDCRKEKFDITCYCCGHKILSLGKQAERSYAAGGYALYIIKAPMATLPQVELKVSGRSSQILIDTGCTLTMLTKNIEC